MISLQQNDIKNSPSVPIVTNQPPRKRRGTVLTEEKVIEARRLRKAGKEYREIKETLGLKVTLANIRHACVGTSWAHVTEPPAGIGCCLTHPEKENAPPHPSVAHMIRPERWERSKAEIEALPQGLNPPEFNAKREAIWAFWGI